MYQLQHHKTLTPARWSQHSVDRQIIMIANELNRLVNGIKDNQNFPELKNCMERTIELIDLTVSCQHGSLQKEILRFRDLFVSLYELDEAQLKRSLLTVQKLYYVLLLLNSVSSSLVLRY